MPGTNKLLCPMSFSSQLPPMNSALTVSKAFQYAFHQTGKSTVNCQISQDIVVVFVLSMRTQHCTKCFIKDFLSKCDQICRAGRKHQ